LHQQQNDSNAQFTLEVIEPQFFSIYVRMRIIVQTECTLINVGNVPPVIQDLVLMVLAYRDIPLIKQPKHFRLSGMEIGFSWMSDLQISEVDISSEDIVICRV
jgi:hypothetical protein